MVDVFIPIIVGFVSYLVAQCFLEPVFRVMALRRNMHIAILQYSNIWGIDLNEKEYCIARMQMTRDTYRSLAAQGISEAENLSSERFFYFFARLYLSARGIRIKEASEKFWAMEADVCDPQKDFRGKITQEIRTHLQIKG